MAKELLPAGDAGWHPAAQRETVKRQARPDLAGPMLEGAEMGTCRQPPDKKLYPEMQPWQAPIARLNICRGRPRGGK